MIDKMNVMLCKSDTKDEIHKAQFAQTSAQKTRIYTGKAKLKLH